jgi:uncharacterized protein (TIGR03437 family)
VKLVCVRRFALLGAFALSLITGRAQTSPPTIQSGGIVSAGAFGGFRTVAPGSWIEIYGSNLAVDSRSWAGSDFSGINAPTSLDGTKVTVGGQPAFMDFISPGQVNAQVPSTVGTGTQSVIVSTPAGTSAAYPITVNLVEPGLLAPASFTVDGNQNVAALFSDGATYALPPGTIAGVNSKRAQPGDVITMYGVGFGPVTPNIPAGQIVQQNNTLALPLQILFGSTPAQVSYSGLAPQAIGLYQFDVTVPNVPASDAVPLTFSVGGSPGTQMLYISVASPTNVGTSSLPQFSIINIFTKPFQSLSAEPTIYAGQNGGYALGSIEGTYFAGTTAEYIFAANLMSVSVSGNTFTLTNVDTTTAFMESATNLSPYAMTSGTMTITLSPQGSPTLGSVTGTYSFISSLATITGTFSGTYVAEQ